MTTQEMISDIWPIALTVVSAVASFAIAWLTHKSSVWVDAQNSQSYDDVIDQAVMSGIAFGQKQQSNSDIRNENVQTAIVESALLYAKDHATHAIAARRCTDVVLREKIMARLAPAIMAAAAMGGASVTVAQAATIANPSIVTSPIMGPPK